MSPDNHYQTPAAVKAQAHATFLKTNLPNIYRSVCLSATDFRGLTMFTGETDDIVVGLRYFNPDGIPCVRWSSGDDFITALANLNKALNRDDHYYDRKACKDLGIKIPAD